MDLDSKSDKEFETIINCALQADVSVNILIRDKFSWYNRPRFGQKEGTKAKPHCHMIPCEVATSCIKQYFTEMTVSDIVNLLICVNSNTRLQPRKDNVGHSRWESEIREHVKNGSVRVISTSARNRVFKWICRIQKLMQFGTIVNKNDLVKCKIVENNEDEDEITDEEDDQTGEVDEIDLENEDGSECELDYKGISFTKKQSVSISKEINTNGKVTMNSANVKRLLSYIVNVKTKEGNAIESWIKFTKTQKYGAFLEIAQFVISENLTNAFERVKIN